jgi:hypothetical protein
MSIDYDSDSNFEYLKCFFCKATIRDILDKKKKNYLETFDLLMDLQDNVTEGEDYVVLECPVCGKPLKVSLELSILRDYRYHMSKPSKKEMKKFGVGVKKKEIEDVPGQKFMWEGAKNEE